MRKRCIHRWIVTVRTDPEDARKEITYAQCGLCGQSRIWRFPSRNKPQRPDLIIVDELYEGANQ